jgi:hypothetical protein
MPALLRYAKTERESKPIVAKRLSTESIALAQFPPHDEETEEILSELDNKAKNELAEIMERAKALGVKISSFGITYDPDYDKYDIDVKYEGQQNDAIEAKEKMYDKILSLNYCLEHSENFDSIGPV